jgi:hypothetical protein
MILASFAKNATEAGLSPFVFTKSKRYAANYSADERSKLLKDIVTMYHDSHRGLVDAELGMEKLLLGIKIKD